MPYVRELFVDTAAYLIGRAVPALIGFVGVAIFVRAMGEHAYGIYSLVFAGTNLLSMVAVGWLSTAILRFQARQERHQAPFGRIISVGLIWACAGAVPVAAAMLPAAGVGIHSIGALAASCLLVIGLNVSSAYTASLQAALRSRAAASVEVLRAVVALPASVAGIFTVHPPYVGAVLGAGCGYAVSGAVARLLAATSIPGGDTAGITEPVSVAVRRLFWFGWPLSLWFGVSLMFPFAERFLIRWFLGSVATGQYAAIYDVTYRGCGFLLLPIVLAIHPHIMRTYALGRETESRRLWRIGLLVQVLLSFAVTLVIAIAGPWIVALTGVRATRTALALVVPLAAAGCVWQIALVSHKILEARQQTRRMLVFLTIALTADVLIDVTMLSRFGIVVAAYALLGAGVLYSLCTAVTGMQTVART